MERAERMRAWSDFVRRTRRFFEGRNFTEISTNYIVPAGAVENSLDCLTVAWKGGEAQLHTSPEIEMKRALGAIQAPIFQICKCFRDDPTTEIHRREFHMLELYVPNYTALQLEELTKELICELSGQKLSFERYSIFDLFEKYAGVDLNHLPVKPYELWDDAFFKVMLEKIEPRFNPEIPTVVYDYPASQGILSELDERGRALRFEIYWKGMELCNGCRELRDPTELKRRLRLENEKRILDAKAPHPEPTLLLEAMASMPPVSGVAIGLDRLFRAVTGFALE